MFDSSAVSFLTCPQQFVEIQSATTRWMASSNCLRLIWGLTPFVRPYSTTSQAGWYSLWANFAKSLQPSMNVWILICPFILCSQNGKNVVVLLDEVCSLERFTTVGPNVTPALQNTTSANITSSPANTTSHAAANSTVAATTNLTSSTDGTSETTSESMTTAESGLLVGLVPVQHGGIIQTPI